MKNNTFIKAFGRERVVKKTKIDNSIFTFFKRFRNNDTKFRKKAMDFFNQRDFEKSLIEVNKLLTFQSESIPNDYSLKANILYNLQRYEEAIHNYELSIELKEDIKSSHLYHQIGLCYLRLHNHTKSIEFFNYGIVLKNSNNNKDELFESGEIDGILFAVTLEKMYNNLASVYYNSGDNKNAEVYCRKSIKTNTKYSNPYLLLFQIYERKDKLLEGYEYLVKAKKLNNSNADMLISEILRQYNFRGETEPLARLSVMQHEKGDLVEAIITAKKIIEFYPNDIVGYYCVAISSASLGDWRSCIEYSKKALNFNDKNTDMLNHLGIALINLGREDEGKNILKRGASLGCKNCADNLSYRW